MWTGAKNKPGYGYFWDGSKLVRAHRYAYELYNGPIPAKQIVLHTCDNPSCVNPEHLKLGYQIDNVKDMVEKDRTSRANNHWNAKLTSEQVKLIKIDTRASIQIALDYNVSARYIRAIKRGQWRVKEE